MSFVQLIGNLIVSIQLIFLIVLSVGLAAAVFFCVGSMLIRRMESPAAADKIEEDSRRVSALFHSVGKVLNAHKEAMVGGLGETDFAELGRCNRSAADSLSDSSSQLDKLLHRYGDLYGPERNRIKRYEQNVRQLDREVAAVEQGSDVSHEMLLTMLREMVEENGQLRSKVSTCEQQVSELIAQSIHSDREARTDALTKLHNRRAWDETVATLEIGRHTSVALIDVDEFKQINDGYGHVAGDGVLSLIGTILRKSQQATAYRLGGDEFALVIHEAKGQRDRRVAEQIRDRVATAALQSNGEKIRVTVSIGVAQGIPGESIESLLIRADKALYAAKNAGGDQVHLNANCASTVAPVQENAELAGI